jgi:hypothetical protein
MTTSADQALEDQIAQWREYVRRRQAIHGPDVEELEGHLRDPVGFAYVRGRWFADDGRMNFVRFSGELAIYDVLIALGGGVFTGFTMMMFQSIGMDAEWLAEGWLVPCGAMGAVLIGSWLVEAKQSVIENMAPVLTRLFTPLFTIQRTEGIGLPLRQQRQSQREQVRPRVRRSAEAPGRHQDVRRRPRRADPEEPAVLLRVVGALRHHAADHLHVRGPDGEDARG